MKSKITLFNAAVLFTASLFLNCSKDIAQSNTQDLTEAQLATSGLEAYFGELFQMQFNHHIYFQGSAHHLVPLEGTACLDASFLDDNQNLISGTLTVNGKAFATHPQYNSISTVCNPGVPCYEQYNEIYFTTENQQVLLDTGLFIPSEIVYTSILFELKENAVLEYAPDSQNSLGVGVIVTFNPTVGKDTYGQHPWVRNFALDNTDDGIFTVPLSLLEGIPNGARVRVELIRGNLVANQSETNSYLIAGYSRTSTTMTLVK